MTHTDLRRAVLERLRAMGKTRYWLARQCGWRPSAIYRMLSRRPTIDKLERMCDVLGLVLRPTEQNQSRPPDSER